MFIVFEKQEINIEGQGCSCQLLEEKDLFQFIVKKFRNYHILLGHSVSIFTELAIRTVIAFRVYVYMCIVTV